jgi:hypothetical protein
MPIVRVWLSHDGYRDADDNLAMLLGAAQARVTAQAEADVRVAGVVFGDTKDGGQFYTLNPTGTAPAGFGTDERYGDVKGNQRAAANYAFFKEYGLEAMKDLGPGWKNFDLLATDKAGLRAWNFDGALKGQISVAAGALANDIVDAIGRTGNAAEAAKLVVYSAGGGANVAAEAIGYLLNQGYAKADLVKHFVVVQHGNNWVTNYEAAARELTRDFTVAISNQNYDAYADGQHGPGLSRAIAANAVVDGSRFGEDFAEALAVAVGQKAFAGLPAGAIFRATRDASDAGSHAFAVDTARLLAALGERLGAGELRTDYALSHLIEEAWGYRSRVVYDRFDPAAIARLLAVAAPEPGDVTTTARITAKPSDAETVGGLYDLDLDLGAGDGGVPNGVGLRFNGLELAAGAEIESAYFVFTAAGASAAGGSLTIEIQNSRAAANFLAGKPIDGRSYLGATVDWDDIGAWEANRTYASADISALIEAVIGDRGLAAADALAFRITGNGAHAAHAVDGWAGAAPQLVINYLHDIA